MRTRLLVLTLPFVLFGCPKKEEPPAPSPAPPGSTQQASAPSVAPSTAKTKKPAPAKEPSKKADAQRLAAYWKAMNEGRKATLDKKWPEANTAFDRALVMMPEDPRAYTERGYAKLLAKDYKGAVADLDRAAQRTNDKKLLAQIHYNYGLAAEARGDVEAARAAFARSNELNPTNAAKKKLEGKSSCTATIEEKLPSYDVQTYDSWKAAYEASRDVDSDLEAWVSEEATLPAFCDDGWKKGTACLARIGSVMVQEKRLLVPNKAGKVLVFELDIVGGRCGGNIESKLLADAPDFTHVWWTSTQGIPVMVTEKNGEMLPCTEKDNECTTACGDDSVTHNDLFVSNESGAARLFVRREGEKDPLKVVVSMPTVKISGKGCDVERTLAK